MDGERTGFYICRAMHFSHVEFPVKTSGLILVYGKAASHKYRRELEA